MLNVDDCKLLGQAQISPNHSTMQADLDELSRLSSEKGVCISMCQNTKSCILNKTTLDDLIILQKTYLKV